MNAQVDLRRLAVHRDETAPAAPPRHVVTRYVLPGVILLGFASVIAWAARDSFLPATPVTVVPVLATRAEVETAGTPLFKAAGWIEPRPTAIQATALAEGVIERLLVVEDQIVKAGEPIAYLIDADAKLALKQAEADLKLEQAQLASAEAALAAARTNLEYPLDLQADVADSEAVLAKAQTEQTNLPFQIQSAEARVRLARQDLEGKAGVEDAISGRAVQRAQTEVDSAQAALEELKVRAPRLAREVKAMEQKLAALAKQLELKTEQKRAVAEAEASVQAAMARVEQAVVAVETSQLRLERMTVRAPVGGRVLDLISQPGMRLMGQSAQGSPDASTVVTLYKPDMLQVRADARLEDIPRVRVGQPALIRTAALAEPIEGEVLFLTSLADIQKNTLEVKIAIKSPPSVLKPEMLVEVDFLAPPNPNAGQESSEELKILVPLPLVQADAGGAVVWIADQAAGVARMKSVQMGAGARGNLVEVEGLTPADKVIASNHAMLEDGARIRITGEEPAQPIDNMAYVERANSTADEPKHSAHAESK